MRVLLVLLLLPLASAYEESEAADVRFNESGLRDVVAVGHSPEVVREGEQFEGFIQFRANHNISQVLYLICDVGKACYGAPTAANRVNDTRWEFDSTNFVNAYDGQPIRWENGMRLGVQYFLQSGDDVANQTAFPHGDDDPETHYFAFNMPPADKQSPGVSAMLLLGLLVVIVVMRRE